MPFHYLEHTADIAFEAEGSNLEELFSAAADATLNAMIDPLDSIRETTVKDLALQTSDLELLLFEFLQEIVYFKDADGLLLRPKDLKIDVVENLYRLTGRLVGERLDPSRHEQGVDVKAVTLHRFSLYEKETGWICHVILDV